MLKTVPLFHAFADMPITREFRFFVQDGTIESVQSYWPPHSIIWPSCSDWREKLNAASVLTATEMDSLVFRTRLANAAVPGYWSVDWLQTADGSFWLTDMAEGGCSFKWGPALK